MKKKKEIPTIPGWLKVGGRAIYCPDIFTHSRYRDKEVEVVCVNRFGQVTIRFIDGLRVNQTRGVKINELKPKQ